MSPILLILFLVLRKKKESPVKESMGIVLHTRVYYRGSLAVRLPKEIADVVGIHAGDDMVITTKDHKIIIEHK